jgi:phage gpG-like protein
MGTQFKLSSKGDKQVKVKLSKIAKGLQNPKPVLKRIGIKLLMDIFYYFRQEGQQGYGGEKWADTQFGATNILQDTGVLRGSFTREIKRNSVEVGSPVEYSEYHQFGEGNMVAREMLPQPDRATKIATEQVMKYVNELKRKKV